MANFRSNGVDNDYCDPWVLLAIAIVQKAADDYRSLAAEDPFVMSYQERAWYNRNVKEIEMFFESHYGNLLCHGKANYILERLQNE